jgi:hypothetical protein
MPRADRPAGPYSGCDRGITPRVTPEDPMRTRFVLVLLAAAAFFGGAANAHAGATAFGLTSDQRLLRFPVRAPHAARTIGDVTGLSGDARLLGIDFRPADGALYGIGDRGGIYTLDPDTAEASFVSQLRIDGVARAPEGQRFGVDFNPAADRLRVVGDGGQDLRIDVATGAGTLDGALNLPGPPPVTAIGVVGAAYTNNDADPATGTTLFDLDTALDRILIQSPPNAGALVPTGSLGVDAVGDVGFDVWTHRHRDGSVANHAYAVVTNGRSKLARVDLLTGRATKWRAFRAGDEVIGLALQPSRKR